MQSVIPNKKQKNYLNKKTVVHAYINPFYFGLKMYEKHMQINNPYNDKNVKKSMFASLRTTDLLRLMIDDLQQALQLSNMVYL